MPVVDETTTRPVEEQRTRIAAAVYGTILVLAVVSYLSEDHELGAGRVAIAVLGTVIVYFAAHVYVDFLSQRLTGAQGSAWELTRWVVREEWPLLHATLAPAVPLLLGAVGVLSRSTAINLTLVVALSDLVGWGYAAGRRTYGTRWGGMRSALVAILLGAVVVGLKNLLH
jgi:hypothetical protein